ncbi:MAG: glycosyltransferase [Chitinophagaceae bacterium]|nr:glycosyltransferase [Chitinophagaceae bacterium]
MIVLIVILVVLLVAYYFLIGYYHNAWMQIPVFENEQDTAPGIKVSVIVPARNEALVIEDCLQSLLHQTYPGYLLEIIIVDDYSDDDTAAIVSRYTSERVKLLSLKNYLKEGDTLAHKKKAIEIGIAQSRGDVIVTTDADCAADKNWINTIVHFYNSTKTAFIVAPVKIIPGGSVLSVFQSIDFAIMQGITGASVYKNFHRMCNGANLAYEKKIFYAVNGFENIDHIASGDDMLLMEKIANKFPNSIGYVKNKLAIVDTLPAESWKQFFNQRIRWASKTKNYSDKKIIAVLAMVYLLNLCLFVLLIGSIIKPALFICFVAFVFYKCIIEWAFVKDILRYFELDSFMPLFPLFQPLHIIYIVISGFFGTIGKYSWKGRAVK